MTARALKIERNILAQFLPDYDTIRQFERLLADVDEFDQKVDDRVATLIQNGVGLTWTYDDANDTLTGDVSLSVFTTDDLAEGANLYYTQARFDSAFGAKSTTDLTEGVNLYYTQARFNTAFSAKSTTDLSEGVNLYYTQARFDSAFTAKDTDALSEGGTNLYFTDARAQTVIDADTSLFLVDGSRNITGNITAEGDLEVQGTVINFANLPTSSAGLATGDLWNDSGTLKIA